MNCKLWPEGVATLAKGGKPPAVNKKMERLQMQLLRRQLKQASEKFKFPEMPTIKDPPPAPPPPSEAGSDVLDAQVQARRDAGKRTGFLSTLRAGETGAYSTLLGGQKG